MNNKNIVFPDTMTWNSNSYRSHTQNNNNNNVMPYDIWKQYEIDPINNRIDDEEEKKNYDIDLEYENTKNDFILPRKKNTMWPMYNTDFDTTYLENPMMNPVFNPNRLFNPNR